MNRFHKPWLMGPMSLGLAVWLLLGFTRTTAALVFNFAAAPDTPAAVVNGFLAAGERWSAMLRDDLTVTVNVGFDPLPFGVIGSTSANFVERDYADVRTALFAGASSADDFSAYAHLQAGPRYTRLINRTADHPINPGDATPYPDSLIPVALTRANGKALGLVSADNASDGTIIFSSNTAFDFDFTDGITAGHYDFVTLAAHEIGHLLGFISVVDLLDQSDGTSLASALPAQILDLFRFSAESRAIGPGTPDTTADTRSKYFSVDGGTTALTPFASGMTYGTGSQASHWREFLFAGYLMDPQLFPGSQRMITPTDLRAFDVLGYRIPEPTSATLCWLGFAACLAVRRHAANRHGSGLGGIKR